MANSTNNVIAFTPPKNGFITLGSRDGALVIDLNSRRSRVDPIEQAEIELFASFIRAGKGSWYAHAVIEYLRMPTEDSLGRMRDGVTLSQFLEGLNRQQLQSGR